MNAPEPIPFNASKAWPEPDMRIARPDKPKAPVLSGDELRLIFGPCADWIETAAEVKGAPVDYVALGLLCSASALIGNSRWASVKPGWKEPPVLWGMLIGEPSAGKSPALDALIDPIRDMEREFAIEYDDLLKSWRVDQEVANLHEKEWKAEAAKAVKDGAEPPARGDDSYAPTMPVRRRVCISDATTESVASLLSNIWRGLLVSRDELSGWLASMDRYSGGGDRPFWLEAYGGRSYTIDRKGAPEPIIVDHLSLAVIGGTQPDKLNSLLVKSDDDGLLPRFLVVYPEPAPLKQSDAEIDEAAISAAFERLYALMPFHDESHKQRPFYIPFSKEAGDVLFEFRQDCRDREADASGHLKGHIGKMPGQVVRVAMVLAHLDYAFDPAKMEPQQIGAAHVERACTLVGQHFYGHAVRAYGAGKMATELGDAEKLAGLILKNKLRTFGTRDLMRLRALPGKSSAQVKVALDPLEEAGWIKAETQNTMGRPRTRYLVNPHIFDALATGEA